mgnify:FL=1
MHLSNLLNKFFKKVFLLTLFFNLNQCGLYKKTDAREVPTNAKERAQKNVEEGRSIKLFGKKGGSGTFEFASSNEMWRAAIDILDFVPLSSADYGGGIVITEWYSDSGQINESVKIMVQFLSNEIRADGLKVVVYDRICENNNLNNCQTQTNQGSLSEEIKLAILKKASVYKNITLKKRAEEYRKKKPIKNKNVKSNTE